MASLESGEVFTDDEVAQMSIKELQDKKVVRMTDAEQRATQGMNRKQRRAFLRRKRRMEGKHGRR